jgi:hypothetical protein
VTTPLTPTQLEASFVAEVASVVSVLDLFVKYETLLETWIPGISRYVPFINKLDAGLKAFQAASAVA